MGKQPKLPRPSVGDLLRHRTDGRLAEVVREDADEIDLAIVGPADEASTIGIFAPTWHKSWDPIEVHASIDALDLGAWIGFKVWSNGQGHSHKDYGYHELLDVWIEEDDYGYEHVIGTIQMHQERARHEFPKGASLMGVPIDEVEVNDLGGGYIIYDIRGRPRKNLEKRAKKLPAFPTVKKGEQEWYALFAV